MGNIFFREGEAISIDSSTFAVERIYEISGTAEATATRFSLAPLTGHSESVEE